jgi:1-acyl-sn-glycerol-3-phosphate acyltransferase
LLVGFGGGMMLGRVDADVLAIAPPDMRGRVFSVKATAFTLILMASLGAVLCSGEAVKVAVTAWMGPGLLVMAIPAFFLAWRVDVSIWCKHADTSVPTGFHAFMYRLWRDMFWLFFRFMFRYEVVGSEKVPKTGPVILAANHGAFIDPLLLGSVTNRGVQYIMFRSYYESIAHPIFRFLRCIPVDSAGPLGALKAGIHSLEQGACIAIFPEGTVCADGKLQSPERGALFLAQRSGATVVPVAICGNHAAWPRQAKLPRFSKIKLIVGEPFVVPKTLSKKEMAEMTDKLMRDLAVLLKVDPPPSTADKIKDRGE